jgi:hypothetical protein
MKGKNKISKPSLTLFRTLLSIAILVSILGPVGVLKATPVAAQTNLIQLNVISANDSATYGIVKGQAIDSYTYIINIDNTGTTEQRSPDPGGCSTTRCRLQSRALGFD